MQFSWWNQYFKFEATTNLNTTDALGQLRAIYEKMNPRKIDMNENQGFLAVEKGSLFLSTGAFGPETWARHRIVITVRDDGDSRRILFDINLKLCGFTVGRNHLLEECEHVCQSLEAAP